MAGKNKDKDTTVEKDAKQKARELKKAKKEAALAAKYQNNNSTCWRKLITNYSFNQVLLSFKT